MAKLLASRAPSDEAFQERLERAAARFSSIHERWTALANSAAHDAARAETSAASRAGVSESQQDSAQPAPDSGVAVAPILGIAMDVEDEHRPRLKTLMGVHPDDPDVDELAGVRSSPAPEAAERASERDAVPLQRDAVPAQRDAVPAPRDTVPLQRDAVPLQRGTPPPLPSSLLPSPGAGLVPASELPAAPAAGPPTAVSARAQAGASAPADAFRTAPAQWSGLAHTASMVAGGLSTAELAALRRSQRRRSWLVGVSSFAATIIVFALAAPRERTLALQWLHEQYQARVEPAQRTVTGSARALQPVAMEPAGKSAGLAQGARLEEPMSAPTAIEEATPTHPARAPAGAPLTPAEPAGAVPVMELARDPGSSTDDPHAAPNEPSAARRDQSSATSVRSSDEADRSSPPSRRTVRSRDTADTEPRSQVAAPRKRSTRAARGAKATGRATAEVNTAEVNTAEVTTAEAKQRAPRSTKERASRQNSPRRDGNSGIIRETPF